jgi:hypothetical protein
MQSSKASREQNAQAVICDSTYLENCGEERVSELVDVVEEVTEERRLRRFLSNAARWRFVI